MFTYNDIPEEISGLGMLHMEKTAVQDQTRLKLPAAL